jgi:hypothetical protein
LGVIDQKEPKSPACDSPYLKASVTVDLFCDKAVPALVPPSLVDQCGRRCVLRPAGWSTLGVNGRAWKADPAVIAPTTGLHPHALAGKYVGATGDVSLGLGAGAKVLVGGSHRTVTLQPLSVEGQVGVNLALGVAGLTLRPLS